jgi:LmbE family N-acetylglucosaminyl deacetylase
MGGAPVSTASSFEYLCHDTLPGYRRQHPHVGCECLQVSKTLACGDVGNGAMASPEDIVSAVKLKLSEYAC